MAFFLQQPSFPISAAGMGRDDGVTLRNRSSDFYPRCADLLYLKEGLEALCERERGFFFLLGGG